jgi:hypothetical protein
VIALFNISQTLRWNKLLDLLGRRPRTDQSLSESEFGLLTGQHKLTRIGNISAWFKRRLHFSRPELYPPFEPCHISVITMFLPIPRWPNGAASGLVQASFRWYTAADAACTIVKPGHVGT